MDNLTELANLRDIHPPEPIGWWPLATGINLLILCGSLIILATLFFTWRYYLKSRTKRHALRLLMLFKNQYQHQQNTPKTSARISELLKRVAMKYYSRTKVANLQGELWINFLNETSKGLDFKQVRRELIELPFQRSANEDLNLLFKHAEKWIRQRRGRCLN